jgi:LAO/AO transport system kinase
MTLWMLSMNKNQNKPTSKTTAEVLMEQAENKLISEMNQDVSSELISLLEQAVNLEKWPIARLISIFERNTEENFITRHQIVSYLNKHSEHFDKQALVLGITGTPGAGKSSLIGETCLKLLELKPDISVAVLAIDPSSHVSGGALLGDRTRTIFPIKDKRLFFRSQASQQDLGGLSKQTFHVTRLLRKIFDIIIIETVGIGQNEIEIQKLSDHTCLVMQPLAGDQVQFMKAGIMEIPNTFIINKCDEDALAKKSLHLLRSSLKMAQIYVHDAVAGSTETQSPRDIFLTSAIKKKGLDELANYILEVSQSAVSEEVVQKQERYFLNKWIRQAYGEFGLNIYQGLNGDEILKDGTFEEKELKFKHLIGQFLTHLQ